MQVAGSVRFFETRLRVYRHTWRASVISSFLNPVMFLAAMGLSLGQLVDEGSRASDLGGVTYLEFLAPGLMVATVMQMAAGDSAWPVMAGIKWAKTYEAALATPVGVRDIIGGHLVFVAARSFFISVAFVMVSALFGAIPVGWGLAATVPATVTGLAFAAPITAYTSSVERETGLSNLFRFGIVPLFLFSGTFFPITQLPGWLQPLAYVTPLWHGVELTRAVALQVGTTFAPVWNVAYLLMVIAVGAVLANQRLERRMVS